MAMTTWSNGQGARDRQAWCLLVSGDVVHRFGGSDIPGVVAVVGRDYTKAGKWSHDTFRFTLAPGVRMVAGREGWGTGTFTEGLAAAVGREHCDTWIEVADALGVSLAGAQAFLRAWRPRAAEALDLLEARLGEMDDLVESPAEVAVNFGGPSRRQREAGYWAWPVVIEVDGREVGRLTPNDGDWTAPVVVGPVRVLAAEHTRGHGGGYVSLRLVAPEGAAARHRQELHDNQEVT